MKKSSKIALWIAGVVLAGGVVFGIKVCHDINKSADHMYKSAGKVDNKRKNGKVSLSDNEPFSVLLLGTDTGALGRNYKGRTDTMIYAVVNPNTKKTTMLSLARDSRVNIAGLNQVAKLNAAYANGGIPMTINTVQNFLDVPVDYYALINMKGVEQLVDAVDGVEVKNDLDFTYEGTHFPVGKVSLDGKEALKFSRMRYDDPQGDFGRQLRQQAIIKAVFKKAVSVSMLTHYNDFLNALDNNIQTNISLNNAMSMQKNYKSALSNMKTYQLKGHGEMIDGQSFQVMSDQEVSDRSQMLKKQLELNK